MNILGNISLFGKNTKKKVSDAAELSKIDSHIQEEKEKEKALFMNIGQALYHNNSGKAEKLGEPFITFFDEIKECERKIMLFRQASFEIKKVSLCPNCGFECEEESLFCPGCGRKIIKISSSFKEEPFSQYDNTIPAKKAEEKICSQCGTKLNDRAVFCPKCGKKF